MSEPMAIARINLPVSMAGDSARLRLAMQQVAELNGLDPESVRNVQAERHEGVEVDMLVVRAEADRY